MSTAGRYSRELKMLRTDEGFSMVLPSSDSCFCTPFLYSLGNHRFDVLPCRFKAKGEGTIHSLTSTGSRIHLQITQSHPWLMLGCHKVLTNHQLGSRKFGPKKVLPFSIFKGVILGGCIHLLRVNDWHHNWGWYWDVFCGHYGFKLVPRDKLGFLI